MGNDDEAMSRAVARADRALLDAQAEEARAARRIGAPTLPPPPRVRRREPARYTLHAVNWITEEREAELAHDLPAEQVRNEVDTQMVAGILEIAVVNAADKVVARYRPEFREEEPIVVRHLSGRRF